MLLLSVGLLLPLARATTFRLTAISLWLPCCFALPCRATADMPDPRVRSPCKAVDDSIATIARLTRAGPLLVRSVGRVGRVGRSVGRGARGNRFLDRSEHFFD